MFLAMKAPGLKAGVWIQIREISQWVSIRRSLLDAGPGVQLQITQKFWAQKYQLKMLFVNFFKNFLEKTAALLSKNARMLSNVFFRVRHDILMLRILKRWDLQHYPIDNIRPIH